MDNKDLYGEMLGDYNLDNPEEIKENLENQRAKVKKIENPEDTTRFEQEKALYEERVSKARKYDEYLQRKREERYEKINNVDETESDKEVKEEKINKFLNQFSNFEDEIELGIKLLNLLAQKCNKEKRELSEFEIKKIEFEK